LKDLNMQAQDIQQLAAWLAATDIDFLALQGPGIDVTIRRDGAAAAEAPAGPAPADHHQASVRAASPGVLLDRIPGRPAPLCSPGAPVHAGSLVALLQIGPLLLPVHAPCKGWAGDWLVAPGTTVGYGTAVLNIDIEPAETAAAFTGTAT
jgi:acetyl-CoA carboxylase biotin carboxyl carrier protein